MTVTLRILLVTISILTTFYVIRKIRKSQMQISDAIFWVVSSFGLILLSVFPNIATILSEILGIYSEINFVFLSIIFIIILKLFTLSIQISQYKFKLNCFIQEYAVREKQKEELTSLKECDTG